MMNEMAWRKSSYSAAEGACVEVGRHSAPSVLVRDTTDRTGPVLTFPPRTWRAFAAHLKASAG
jgi:hypothetical protein